MAIIKVIFIFKVVVGLWGDLPKATSKDRLSESRGTLGIIPIRRQCRFTQN